LNSNTTIRPGKFIKKYVETEPQLDSNYSKLIKLNKKKESGPVKIYKTAAAAYTSLGNKLKKNPDQWKKAIQQYEKAVILDSTNYSAFDELVTISDTSACRALKYRKEKQFEQAVEEYSLAINAITINFVEKDSTKAVKLYNSRGLTYQYNGKPWNAKKDFRKAIKLDSTYSSPLYNLSRLFFAEGNKFNEALRLAHKTRAIKIQERVAAK